MKTSPSGSTSSASMSRRSYAFSTRARAWMLFGLVPVWLLATEGCYSGGRNAARGAFDEAHVAVDEAKSWWKEEGRGEAKALAEETSAAAVSAATEALQKKFDAARERLQAEWQARVAEVERKVKEGTATPLEIALWVLCGGLGAGGTKTVLERVLIGKRAGNGGNGA